MINFTNLAVLNNLKKSKPFVMRVKSTFMMAFAIAIAANVQTTNAQSWNLVGNSKQLQLQNSVPLMQNRSN